MRIEITLSNAQEAALTRIADQQGVPLDAFVTTLAQGAVQDVAAKAIEEHQAQLVNDIRRALPDATRNQLGRIATILGITP